MDKLIEYQHLLTVNKPFIIDNLKEKDYWATPKEVVENIQRLTGLNFNLDACANKKNTKCEEFITEEQNTLITDWGKYKQVFMNPPYCNPLPFIIKAVNECYRNHNQVAILLNIDTSTRWFKVCEVFASQIYFITSGRISFLDYRTKEKVKGNNKPQMIAVFYPPCSKKYSNKVQTYFIDINNLQ